MRLRDLRAVSALALCFLLAACGASSMPNLNRSFDDLACASRDFQGEEPC